LQNDPCGGLEHSREKERKERKSSIIRRGTSALNTLKLWALSSTKEKQLPASLNPKPREKKKG